MTGQRDRSTMELWIEASGDQAKYIELLKEAGHLVPAEPCAECQGTDRHRHDPHDGRAIAIDVFGHDVR